MRHSPVFLAQRPNLTFATILAASVVLNFLGPPERAAAQRGPGAAATAGPGWLPRTSRLDRGREGLVTAAERVAVANRLAAIERLVRQVDGLARPDAFEVVPMFAWTGPPATPRDIIGSQLVVNFFSPSFKRGQGSACIVVTVNPDPGAMIGSIHAPFRDDDSEIFIEPGLGDSVPGALAVYGTLSPTEPSIAKVLLTAGGESPWRDVSRERFLRAVIHTWEGKSGEEVARQRAFLSVTPYQRWLSEAPKRKKEREKVVAGVAALDRTQAAKTRALMEQTERELGERLKASEAADREEAERQLAIPTTGATVRAQVAAMSPAERATPAWIHAEYQGSFQFVPPRSPQSARPVAPNPAFYRARRSPMEVRGILVTMSTTQSCQSPSIIPIINRVLTQLDWAALAAMIDSNPR